MSYNIFNIVNYVGAHRVHITECTRTSFCCWPDDGSL